MTPEEAIKEMSSWKLDIRLQFSEKHEKAIKLGIEALKLNLSMRETYHAPELLVLPSETEE